MNVRFPVSFGIIEFQLRERNQGTINLNCCYTPLEGQTGKISRDPTLGAPENQSQISKACKVKPSY